MFCKKSKAPILQERDWNAFSKAEPKFKGV